MKKILILPLCLLILEGCKKNAASDSSMSITLDSLRAGSGPNYHITYHEFLRKALEVAPVLQEFRTRVKDAELRKEGAFIPNRTKVNFLTSYKMNYAPGGQGSSMSAFSDSFDVGFQIKKVIADFGRARWAGMAGELSEKSAIEEYRRALNRFVLDATVVYLNAGRLQENIDSLEVILAMRKKHFEIAKKRFEAGEIPRVDLLKAENEVSLATDELAQSTIQRRQNFGTIYALMNEKPVEKPILVDPLDPLRTVPTDEDAGLKLAFDRRPEITALKWSIEAAKAHIKYAELGNAPTVSIEANVGHSAASGIYQPSGLQWSVMMQLSIPIFDGGLTANEIKLAENKLQSIQAGLAEAQQLITQDVDYTFVSLSGLATRKVNLQKATDNALQALRLSQAKFEKGLGNQTEVFEAFTTYQRSQLALNALLQEFREAGAKWNWAISEEAPIRVPGPRTQI